MLIVDVDNAKMALQNMIEINLQNGKQKQKQIQNESVWRSSGRMQSEQQLIIAIVQRCRYIIYSIR